MRRLGLVGRILVILTFALVAFWSLASGLIYLERTRARDAGQHSQLPEQIAAVIELYETAPADQRPRILRAVNGSDLRISVEQAPPFFNPLSMQRLPAVERAVARALPTPREVIAFVERPLNRFGRPSPLPAIEYTNQPARVAVSLRQGSFLVAELRGEPSRRVFGLPPGFWLGALGCTVAVVATYALMREARPLRALANAVARFAESAEPHYVTERGAPEIRALIRSVNGMQDRIAALLKGRTFLLGSISHDLKTYITRLRLRAEMIEDNDQRERAVKDLEEMTRLVESAMAYARASIVSEAREPVELIALLEAEAEARHSAGQDVTFATEVSQLRVLADPLALRRALANVIDNAVRYGNCAKVWAGEAAAKAHIVVDDAGPGIPEAERLAVFEPFYRLEASRSRLAGGTGLGLAITQQIIAAHGGSVAIDDAPGGGARLVMSLPRAGASARGQLDGGKRVLAAGEAMGD